jgi:hypothetical protein
MDNGYLIKVANYRIVEIEQLNYPIGQLPASREKIESLYLKSLDVGGIGGDRYIES